MKKCFYYSSIIVLSFAACTKEVNEQLPDSSEGQKKVLTFQAVVEGTKTTESSAVYSWTPGETISIGSFAQGYRRYYDFTSEDGDGRFKGVVDEGASVILAVSPAQTNDKNAPGSNYPVYSASNFAVTLPTDYTYSPGVTNAILVGDNKNDSGIFIFHQTAALIKAKYVNIPSSAVSIKLTADQNITGTVNPGSRTDPSIQLGSTGLDGNSVTISFTSEQREAGLDYFYFPVPYGTYGSIQLELLDSDANTIDGSVRTLSSGITLEKGDVYTVPTITLFGDTIVVGNTDKSSEFNDNAISPLYTIKPGQVLHLKFINHGNTSAVWHNWALEIWKNADYTHLCTVRADNYGWGNNETNDNLTGRMNTWIEGQEWSYTDFSTILDGASVNLSIEYVNNLVMVYAECYNSSSEKTVKKTFFKAVDSSSWGTLKANLRCDLSYMEIQNVWRTKSNADAGLTSEETYYIHESDLDIQYVKVPESAKLIMTNGVSMWAHNNYTNADIYSFDNLTSGAITAPTASVAAGENGTSVVAFNSENSLGATVDGVYTTLTIPWTKGLTAMGAPDYSLGWAWAPNYYGNISNGETVVIQQFLYSPATTWNDDKWKNIITQFVQANFAAGDVYKIVRLDPAWWDGNNYAITETNDWTTLGTDDFSTQLNRSMVTITIAKTSAALTVRYDVLLRNGETHYQQYVIEGIVEETLAWHHCADFSYAVITSYNGQ